MRYKCIMLTVAMALFTAYNATAQKKQPRTDRQSLRQ